MSNPPEQQRFSFDLKIWRMWRRRRGRIVKWALTRRLWWRRSWRWRRMWRWRRSRIGSDKEAVVEEELEVELGEEEVKMRSEVL